jgi:cellobiose phosphorylase
MGLPPVSACIRRDEVPWSHAWDGEWYVRYFDAEGSPLGSSKTRTGRFISTGSLAGDLCFASPIEPPGNGCSLHNSTQIWHQVCAGFNGYDLKYGGVTTYPPGQRKRRHLPAPTMGDDCRNAAGNGERATNITPRSIQPLATI